jgi:hypothetical protein
MPRIAGSFNCSSCHSCSTHPSSILFTLSKNTLVGNQELIRYLASTVLVSDSLILDIHLGNIFLRLPKSFDSMSPRQLCKEFGTPRLEPLVPLDKQPLPKGVPKSPL